MTAALEGGTVALRDRGTDGVLRLWLHNRSRDPVEVALAPEPPDGAVLRGASPSVLRLQSDGTGRLSVRYAVRRCDDIGPTAVLQLSATASDGRRTVVEAPVGPALTAGCRPGVVPGVEVVGVRVVGGQATVGADGLTASGAVVLEVVSAGVPVRLVAVSAEVPGVLFVAPTLPVEPLLRPGARRTLTVPFTVPFCPALRPRGRVTVTVRGADDVLREVASTVAGDGEARVARDVDLDLVLRSCAASP